MKRDFGLSSMIGSAAAVVVMVAQPAQAAPTQITNVQVNSTGEGAEVVLVTRNGDRPQVFTVSRGNALVADVINTQLQLPEGNGFLQNNPAPGITSVSVTQLDANSVRVVVTGEADPPAGEIASSSNRVVLNVTPGGAVAASSESPPASSEAAESPPSAASAPSESTTTTAQTPEQQVEPSLDSPSGSSEVLVPAPGVTIDGVPVLQPSQTYVPPTLPAPIPPPIGDIATSGIDTAPPEVNLGTSEIVPRLVLRDAPVRDVLSLLARAAGLNVAYVGDVGAAAEGDAAAAADPGAEGQVRISLDIENEPVQNVFNYVIRIAGLDVNRVGRTIFVGPRLPNSARQLLTRTMRLNQVPIDTAIAFLVGLGAETAVSRERLVTTVTAAPITTEEGLVVEDVEERQTTQAQETRIEVQRVDYQDVDPLLRGLQVIGDQRTNSVTLVGAPRQIEIAAAQLAQLDIRRRQVAVNVRVIDVNLEGIDRFSSSFSFGIDDTRVVNDNGVGIINFGSVNQQAPFGSNLPGPDNIGTTVSSPTGPVSFDFIRNFIAQLQFAVTNGNAKILTDPTLVVQEGQLAEVQLTQDVVTNVEREIETSEGVRTETVTVERTPAGLILQVQVDRIDDNGFVSLSVAPAISAPTATQTIDVGQGGGGITITLLAVRRVSSGQVRVRDGQTLVLSGIIQDQDRATVTKIPILGDIPILGALFRSVERQNTRQEVIVMLTPHIIDDSDTSTFGYRYTPTTETQEYIQEQNIQVP
ncbi:MAG: AMIN domain-containing protein [Elainellaceae cyanobacterium]